MTAEAAKVLGLELGALHVSKQQLRSTAALPESLICMQLNATCQTALNCLTELTDERLCSDVADGANSDGVTPLHCTALAGSAECAQLLLDAKANSLLSTHDGR